MLATLADAASARLAGPEDEEALVAMVRRMHADPEWGLRDWEGKPFPFCEERVRERIQAATVKQRNAADAGSACIGVVGAPGHLLSSVYLRRQEPELSGGRYIEEVWNWVAPEHRRGDASQLLLNFAITLADECQLTLVSAARMYENAGRARFLQKRIGRPVSSVFAYNATAGTV